MFLIVWRGVFDMSLQTFAFLYFIQRKQFVPMKSF